MAINSVDIKILWGRAGGRCSCPGCDEDLTTLLTSGNYVIGEMAHVIGRQPTAARGAPNGGSDAYDNLILLCPNHHTHIDKSPEGTYPIEMLHQWKAAQEEMISSAGKVVKYDSYEEMHFEVARLLVSNGELFRALGPDGVAANSDPESNAYLVWELRKVDRILPNNRRILGILDANSGLIKDMDAVRLIEQFRVHAEAYERHVYHRMDEYPLFPDGFLRMFS